MSALIVSIIIVTIFTLCIWKYINSNEIRRKYIADDSQNGIGNCQRDNIEAHQNEINGVEDIEEKDQISEADALPKSRRSFVLNRKVHSPKLKRSKSATDWRTEGNHSYKRACSDGLSPVLQEHRLTTALECYKQSLDACDNDDEKSSIYKNISVASSKLAGVLCQQNRRQKCFKQALKNYILASSTSSSKPQEWIDALNASLQKTIKNIIDDISYSNDCKSTAEDLQSYLSIVVQNAARAPFLQHLIQLRFDMGSEAFHQKKYEVCFQEMYDCKRLLNDLKCCNGTLEPHQEIMMEEVDIFITVSESNNYRLAGDRILANLVKQKVPFTKDRFECVIMQYRKAAEYAKNQNIIAQATALSCLGHVYDILNYKLQAKSYYKECLDIVKNVDKIKYENEDWYQNCIVTLERYRDSIIVQPSERWKITKERYIGEVRDKITELELISKKGHVPFLMHLYTKYPPKTKNNVFTLLDENEKIDKNSLKKLYKKARLHYHSDKVDVPLHGEEWKVFCEEISILLNAKASLLN